jgi:hypothetical protein
MNSFADRYLKGYTARKESGQNLNLADEWENLGHSNSAWHRDGPGSARCRDLAETFRYPQAIRLNRLIVSRTCGSGVTVNKIMQGMRLS